MAYGFLKKAVRTAGRDVESHTSFGFAANTGDFLGGSRTPLAKIKIYPPGEEPNPKNPGGISDNELKRRKKQAEIKQLAKKRTADLAAAKKKRAAAIQKKQKQALADARKRSGGILGDLKAIGKGVTSVPGAVGKALGKVPVVGTGLKGVYDLTVNKPFQIANDIASGKRLDQVAIRAVKREVQTVRDVAPYAQTVISVVPGVGTGISAGLSAGLALASGQPISTAITEAIKGAVPGGALAKTAFDVGRAAVEGKPITEVALAVLPVGPKEKKAIAMGLDTVSRIAKGERVDKALIAQADKAIGLLPKDTADALGLGIAVQEAKSLQNIAIKAVNPKALNDLKQAGAKLVKASPVLATAGKVISNQAEKAGFSVGIGMMAHTIRPIDAVAIRSKLNAQQKKGFDLAVAAKAGMVDSKFQPPKTVKTPEQAFGYYTTRGLTGTQNTGSIIRAVANPKAPTSAGAAVALKKIETDNKSWWHRLVSYLKDTF